MIGTVLNQYRITASIGAGGMGEVFRARDTRLNRDVAVKVLPKDFVADADRLRRFEQEAKTLAALNHPNVLTVFDAGVHEGAPYLVSELLEGRTLREEMKGAPLPVRKATEFALQIANGLAAAHGKGVIHRDLKPENIFVTKDGRVKILDFGLAKLRPGSAGIPAGTSRTEELAGKDAGAPKDIASDNTATTRINTTEPGMVLGTPAYMSPEQVRGEPADHRADIFAFGAVLYEMLSGTRAFRRDTPVASMNAVLNEEPPDLSESQSTVSPALERIVRRCLEKIPERRFQSATDLAFALENISSSGFTASAGRIEARRGVSWQSAFPWAVAALCLIMALGAILYSRRSASSSFVGNDSPAAPAPLRKLEIRLPLAGRKGTSDLLTGLAISPDGRKLAYANADGLWLRSLERLDPPTLVSAAEKVSSPFWSPQSTDVAWFEGTSLKRAPVTGGRAMTICRTITEIRADTGEGGAWLQTDEILFTTGSTGLYRVPAQGGNAELILPPGEGEVDFHHVSALPDGRGVVFIIHRREGVDTIGVWNPKDGKDARKTLFQRPGSHLASPVMTSAGHVVFLDRSLDARENLWAVPISRSALELAGEPLRLIDGGFLPSASSDGTLALSLHDWGYSRFAQRRLVWVDRSGRIGASLGNVHKGMSYPQLSPDERFVAFAAGESFETMQIWILDGTTGSAVPLRPEGGDERNPFWLPGGREIVVSAFRSNQLTSVIRAIEGSRPSEAIGRGTVAHVSRSGQYAFLFEPGATPTNFYVRLTGDRTQPIPLPSGSPSLVDHRRLRPNLSPDDATLAFQSEESDQPEIWAVAFPGFTNRVLVSRGGGSNPRWSRDGTELFYLSGDARAMMTARFVKQSGRQFAEPVKLFDLPESIFAEARGGNAVLFDVSADGQRFLMMQNVPEPNAPSPEPKVLLIQNWFEEYRAKK